VDERRKQQAMFSKRMRTAFVKQWWFWIAIVIIGCGYFVYNFIERNNVNTLVEISYPEGEIDEEQAVKKVFQTRLDAMENCDIELANSLVTKKSLEILRSTCENMENERKCYAGKETLARTKSNTAVLYFTVYNHKEGWPFFFEKEGGEWKIDFYTMAKGIAMIGGGCDTGWSWRDEGIKKDFCGFFPRGECPEDLL